MMEKFWNSTLFKHAVFLVVFKLYFYMHLYAALKERNKTKNCLRDHSKYSVLFCENMYVNLHNQTEASVLYRGRLLAVSWMELPPSGIHYDQDRLTFG